MMENGQKTTNIDDFSDFDSILIFFKALNVIKPAFFNQIKKKNNLLIEIFFHINF